VIGMTDSLLRQAIGNKLARLACCFSLVEAHRLKLDPLRILN
jgi:hypothetical protein